MFRCLCLAVAGLLTTGCASHLSRPDGPAPTPVHTDFHVSRDITISPAEWPQKLEADIYRPDGKGPFPAVLVLYGGGWHAGNRWQMMPVSMALARRGYVAIATTYRLAPQYRFPAQLEDVELAVRWMRTSGIQYGIDPVRIGAWGYSAGAHLAALLGGVNADDPLGAPDVRIQAVVAGGTPSDLTKPVDNNDLRQLFGGSYRHMPGAYRAASPVNHVDAGDPPVFLYHGGADHLVTLDHATDYKALLDRAGIPNELMILRGRGHLLAYLTDGPAVQAALEFLDRHLRDGH